MLIGVVLVVELVGVVLVVELVGAVLVVELVVVGGGCWFRGGDGCGASINYIFYIFFHP